MASGASIGMMDPAYFVGRRQILEWLNSTFSMSLTKIEQTASGAVACQIMDMIYPGTVPMGKVRWDARSEDQFIQNYKILQRVFEKRGIDKHVDVTKLIRAKYQDNLEMMQWMKNFFDHNCAESEYDAVERRAKGKGADSNPIWLPSADGGKKAASTGQLARRSAPSGVIRTNRYAGSTNSSGGQPGPAASTAAPTSAAPAAASGTRRGGASMAASRSSNASGGSSGAAARKVSELNSQVKELKLNVEALERERDFYFGKLRDVEILLQTYGGGDKELVDKMFKILYATEEDFVTVDEDGNELSPEEVAAQATAQALANPAGSKPAAPQEEFEDAHESDEEQ